MPAGGIEFTLRHVKLPAHLIDVRRLLLGQRGIGADRVIEFRAESARHRIIWSDSLRQHFVDDRLGFGHIAFP